ncbi:Protein of unknown function [Cotesia congregata]|uniref:Uncharacterized protein n=1 Tax=Cotesia congregata TaxID=51543 RepID=A0A8J2MM67_COTCN|nr:Protein of unknown function [Cotesia congregata]
MIKSSSQILNETLDAHDITHLVRILEDPLSLSSEWEPDLNDVCHFNLLANNEDTNSEIEQNSDSELEEEFTPLLEPWPKRIQRLEELRHKIELNMRKESERQEKYHGVNHEIPEVSVGDLVYYPNRKLSNKAAGYSASLGVKYLGPVMVSKIISPLVVELKNDKGKVLGQHYVPDLKIPRLMKRRRVEFYVRGTRPDEDVVAGINVGGETANTTSVAVQCSLQAEDRVDQKLTARESALTRLGPVPTPGLSTVATENPSVVNPVGVVDMVSSMEVDSAGFARPFVFARVGDNSRKTVQNCLSKRSKWHGLTPNQSRMARRRLSLNKALENPETKESTLWELWLKAATREERDLYGKPTHLGPMMFGASSGCQEVGSETLPKSSEASAQVTHSQPMGSPPAVPAKASSLWETASTEFSVPKRLYLSRVGEDSEQMKLATKSSQDTNREVSQEASKGAIPRTRLASVVVSVQKERQVRSVVFKKPRESTSTVTSGSWAASTAGASALKSKTSEARPVALRLGPPPVPAFPSGSLSGGDASYLLGPGPMLPAFADYRASLAAAVSASTSQGGRGIPRIQCSEPPRLGNALPVKRSKKKKKRKDGVRGMDWGNAEFVCAGDPISEDSGMELDPYDDRDKTDDDDVLQINYDEDL